MKRIFEYYLSAQYVVFVVLKDVTLPVCVTENESYAKVFVELLSKHIPSKKYYYEIIDNPIDVDCCTTAAFDEVNYGNKD